MGKDKILGIVLISLALLMAPGLGLLFFRQGSLHLVLLAAPAVLFLVGLLLLFTSLLENSLSMQDELEELPQLVEDDIQALDQRRPTPTHLMLGATVVTAMILFGLLFWHQKWEVSWGPLNIFAVSAVMVAFTLIAGLRSRWFQRRRRRTKGWVFLIPLAGLIVSVGLGVYATEPKEFGGQTRSSGLPVDADGASQVVILGIDMVDDVALDFDCDGEECLLLLLIFVVIVCIVASAFIPHFWVLAGHLLLTVMALIALRELLVAAGAQAA